MTIHRAGFFAARMLLSAADDAQSKRVFLFSGPLLALIKVLRATSATSPPGATTLQDLDFSRCEFALSLARRGYQLIVIAISIAEDPSPMTN